MAGPDRDFWQQRFLEQQTPWDRGAPSPQLPRWLAEGVLAPGMRVAVPGCGAGHEVVALARAGIDVVALDYAPAAITLLEEHLARERLTARTIEADVLAWQPDAPFDAVYEQTCLCALHPDHWAAYAAQLHRWLRAGGRLAMLAMQAPRAGSRDGLIEGPPYHVEINALRAIFPSTLWHWPKPPYARVDHPAQASWSELALVLERR